MRQKLCHLCRRLLPVTDFCKYGGGRRNPNCRPCYADQRRLRPSRGGGRQAGRRPYGSVRARIVDLFRARREMRLSEVVQALGFASAAWSVVQLWRGGVLVRVARGLYRIAP